jgi:predicted transposase YdaD
MNKENVKQEDVKSENAQHDRLFKDLIARSEIVREFVEHDVELSFAGLLDLSTIKFEKDSFVEPKLRLKLSDKELVKVSVKV